MKGGVRYESVGGDIKFLRLAQQRVGGLVTDGSVRDSASLRECAAREGARSAGRRGASLCCPANFGVNPCGRA